jgi:hypothetical protein
MNAKYIWVWFTLSSMGYAMGEILSKRWANNPSIMGAVYIFLAYGFCTLLWLPTMICRNQLIINSIIYIILASIATIIVGLGFAERITAMNIVGIMFGVVGVILMSL